MVDDSDLSADGLAGVALVRPLEGAMLALKATDRPMISTVGTAPAGSAVEKLRDS